MLRASARVLVPGGVTAFYVIATAPGLSLVDLARATMAGPTDSDAGPGYEALLPMAGFTNVTVEDVTAEYRVTLRDWLDAYRAEASDLERLIGPEEFAERQDRRVAALAAIDDGLLVRQLVRAVTGRAVEHVGPR